MISLSYLHDLSRVRITLSGLPDGAARVERSPNGTTLWETVRGGVALPVTGGGAVLDDYEFLPDVLNHYRATMVEVSNLETSHTTPGVYQASITPSLGGRVWLKSIRWPFLNRPVRVVNWRAIDRTSRDAAHVIAGRSVPVATSDRRLAPQFVLRIATDDYADPGVDPLPQAMVIDLMLAAGGVLLVHVPAGVPVPGGYVAVGDASQDRVVPHGRVPHVWDLPCQVVAPPGPDVVGGTMTYATLLRLYGGYTNVLAANPAYADVLAQMADPEDLVVL